MEEQPSSVQDFGGVIKGVVCATFTAIFIVWKVNGWFGGRASGMTTVAWVILAIGLSLAVIIIVVAIVAAVSSRILEPPGPTPDSQAISSENAAPSFQHVAPAVDQWWLIQFGRPTGPHTTTALREAAAAGDFPLDSQVCHVGSLRWLTLQELVDTPVPMTPVPTPAAEMP